MPTLELSPTMLKPGLEGFALVYLESVMLWPDDAEKREAVATAFCAALSKALLQSAAANDDMPHLITPSELLSITAFLTSAPPRERLQGDGRLRYIRGTQAATIFIDALHDSRSERPSSLTKVKEKFKGRA
jgi:hypothetical protein